MVQIAEVISQLNFVHDLVSQSQPSQVKLYLNVSQNSVIVQIPPTYKDVSMATLINLLQRLLFDKEQTAS